MEPAAPNQTMPGIGDKSTAKEEQVSLLKSAEDETVKCENDTVNANISAPRAMRCKCCCCYCRPKNKKCLGISIGVPVGCAVLLAIIIAIIICQVEFNQCDRSCSQKFCEKEFESHDFLAEKLECYFSNRYTGKRHISTSRKYCDCFKEGTLITGDKPIDRYMEIVNTSKLDKEVIDECCIPAGSNSQDGINVPRDTCIADGGVRLHVGPCGKCSNASDHQVYVDTKDTLTKIALMATVKALFSKQWGLDHYRSHTGLTNECSVAWLANSQNTIIHCFATCAFGDKSSCGKDGELTECFKCDEGHSGLLFRNMAGMTRRRSGIVTDICRHDDEIA